MCGSSFAASFTLWIEMPMSAWRPSICRAAAASAPAEDARRRDRRRAQASDCRAASIARPNRVPAGAGAGRARSALRRRSFSRTLAQRQPAAKAPSRMCSSGRFACWRSVTMRSGGLGSLTCPPGRIAGSTAPRRRASGCGRRDGRAVPPRPRRPWRAPSRPGRSPWIRPY